VLTVPGHLTVAKLISTPVMASAKRRKIIRFEAQQSFPNELDELVWSHATVAVRDGEILSLVAAAKCGDMEAVCAGVGSAGFVPRQVVPSVTALIRAFHTTIPRSRSGCCSSASERARRICS
jgi:hypothetical protein